jgi:hypothetical protein
MRTTICAAAAAVLLLAASAADAATVRYQTGFEPSEYTLGNLIGQHGWDQADGAPPLMNALVENSVVRPVTGGQQAVQYKANGPAINPNADFTDIWTPLSGVGSAQLAIEPIVTIQWDMMRGTLATGQAGTALWGIDVYDGGAANITATIGAYDDSLGPAVAGTDAGGNFVFLGDGSPRGTWDSYTVTMNYVTRQYTVALNGNTLGSPQSFFVGANSAIGDVDFLALTRGTDSAYFDNLSITTSPIPEPATIALLPGVIALVRRRR